MRWQVPASEESTIILSHSFYRSCIGRSQPSYAGFVLHLTFSSIILGQRTILAIAITEHELFCMFLSVSSLYTCGNFLLLRLSLMAAGSCAGLAHITLTLFSDRWIVRSRSSWGASFKPCFSIHVLFWVRIRCTLFVSVSSILRWLEKLGHCVLDGFHAYWKWGHNCML